MKQKLIAIGSDGCRIVSAMLDAGLFRNIPVIWEQTCQIWQGGMSKSLIR